MNTLPAHNYKTINDLIKERIEAQQAELKDLQRVQPIYEKIVSYLIAHPISEDHKVHAYSSHVSLSITATPDTTYAWFDDLTTNLALVLGRTHENIPNIMTLSYTPQLSRDFWLTTEQGNFLVSTSLRLPPEGLRDVMIKPFTRLTETTNYNYTIFASPSLPTSLPST
jgi:hypothetical protein